MLMVPARVTSSPRVLAGVLFGRQRATVLQATPALVLRLPREVLCGGLLGRGSCVRVLAFGGERCPSPAQISSWRHPEVRFGPWLLKMAHSIK